MTDSGSNDERYSIERFDNKSGNQWNIICDTSIQWKFRSWGDFVWDLY